MYKQVGEKIYIHKETTNGQQHTVSVLRWICFVQVVQRSKRGLKYKLNR